MIEALELPFFRRVLVAGLLASVACGVIGTYVVTRRITSVSGGISHAAFGGVGLGYLCGFSPLLGAAGFAVASGLLVGVLHRYWRSGLDTGISMVWAVGMALGILFVSMTPGYVPDLTSYLFGSLLLVPWSYVAAVAVLDGVILVVVAVLWKELEAVSFDEEFAEVAGVPVNAVFLTLLALTALAVVTLIRVVGVILVIALLSIPAAVGRQWSQRLVAMMAWATLVAAACTVAGLFLAWGLSAHWNVSAPPGPLIILLAAAVYGVSGLARALRRRTA